MNEVSIDLSHWFTQNPKSALPICGVNGKMYWVDSQTGVAEPLYIKNTVQQPSADENLR